MAYFQNDLDSLIGDFDTNEFYEDFEDELEHIPTSAERLETAYDSEYEFDMNEGDPPPTEAGEGKDIQGIPWARLNHSRDKYRELRLQSYKNFLNLTRPCDDLKKECKPFKRGSKFYDFHLNTRAVNPTIVHFQLRNLVWATSKHDVYTMQDYSIMHWSPMRNKPTEILNVARRIVPSERNSSRTLQSLSHIQVSTMSVKDKLLVAGGFQGELICKPLDKLGVSFCAKITHDANSITNAVEIFSDTSGTTRIMSANNDLKVRVFDTEKGEVLSSFDFPWSVNCTSVSPDGKLVTVLGDCEDCLLVDTNTGKTMGTLRGHLDYSFSSAWHPNGYIVATGNQDMTCRLWDIRKHASSLSVLKGHMGAIRAIKFSSDGRFMAMAEPADFVHIFDIKEDFDKSQEVDLFGEIAGISFSPDTEALFIGVSDRAYGSLLEFKRRHTDYCYLDGLL